ncbi:MAG: hypothetical protein NW208_03105 [Bryobacter sp.]|nr:hypothetical protein [Bryobacter sp.]
MITTLAVLLVAASAHASVFPLDVHPTAADAPIRFEAEQSQVVDTGTGYQVTGDVALVTPGRRFVLTGSDLFFAFAPGTRTIERVRGRAYVPSPYEGPNVTIKQPALAEFGMDLGKNIEYQIPLQPERTYLYFKFDAGFAMEIGATGDEADTKPLTLAIPAGINALMLIDPTDPFFFVSGGVLLPEGMQKGEDSQPSEQEEQKKDDESDSPESLGFGVSVQSLIPFRPAVTYGIEGKAREFNGNRILTGSLPLGKLPVVFTGTMISDVMQPGSSEKAIDPLGIGFGPYAQAGINGQFDFGFPFLKVKKLGALAEFGFRLGKATAALEIVNGKQHAYFSGIMSPDTSWVPDIMPIKPEREERSYVYVSSDLQDFVIGSESRYAVDASALGKMAGIDLGDIFVVEGSTRIDSRGMRLTGETSDNLGSLGFSSHRKVELWIPFDESLSGYLLLDGANRVMTLRIQGQARFDKTGAVISGRLDTNQLDIEVRSGLQRQNDGRMMFFGDMTVPQAWQLGAQQSIAAEAEAHKAALAKFTDELKKATENYEFELSLRGMRRIMPGICDQIIDALYWAERTAHKRIDDRWPWYAPGKGNAKSAASNEFARHRSRIATLKTRVQSQHTETVRRALLTAINDVLNNKTITIRVSVVGTVYSGRTITTSQEQQLLRARDGVLQLPAASSRKVSAERAWKEAPKREELMAMGDAIAQNITSRIPRIQAIGFSQYLGPEPLRLSVRVSAGGSTRTLVLGFSMNNLGDFGREIGRSIANLF